MKLESQLTAVADLLEDRSAKHGVTGAVLAVLQGDETFETATGVVNRNTGVEATTDSVFQIGSITKLFTATLVMQLVDEGLVNLDSPVRRYLPEFQVADAHASAEVTVAQLLSHTSGIDGDYFLDTGAGDDCIERYVLACSALPQLHRPGEMHSYCNAGFVIAGRIIEKLRGKPWRVVLAERICSPLGLATMGTEPEQAILHRAAVGHMALGGGGEAAVIPIWRLARSNGPAGATPFARARDLLTFARLHIDGGKAAGGTALLSPESVRLMQERQIDLPPHSLASGWGLGWMHFDWGDGTVIGHDGETIGQASFLRVLPENGTAISLLTTGGDAASLYRDVFQEVLGELSAVSLPPPPEDSPTVDVPLSSYEGRYGRLAISFDLTVEDGPLMLSAIGHKPPWSLLPLQKSALRPIGRGAFAVTEPSAMLRSSVLFSGFDASERPAYLHQGGRANPRKV
jgi:CubicO group peptidase (beta-lactamase class C family)